jgi:hypothetical protein
MDPKSPKRLDQVRDALYASHYSYRNERTYIDWIKRFIIFHSKRHPNQTGVCRVAA